MDGRFLVRLFGTVYTTDEVVLLVDRFMDDIRKTGLGKGLEPGAEADKWCVHLSVAFEKKLRAGQL